MELFSTEVEVQIIPSLGMIWICRKEHMRMANTYLENLCSTVIDASKGNSWETAVLEWDIVDCEEDSSCSSTCICGKESIKYLYTIQNKYNANQLFPIGSSCIKKFGRSDLSTETTLIESQFKLWHAIENNKFLSLSSEFFSKKLLTWLYEEGAFNTSFNSYDGYGDYEFMLKMFNKRDKNSITTKQDKKIKAIILNSIKPFMQKRFSKKCH